MYDTFKNNFLFEIWLELENNQKAILVLSQPFQKKNQPYPKYIERGNFTNLVQQIEPNGSFISYDNLKVIKKTTRDFLEVLGLLKPQLELYLNSTIVWLNTDQYTKIPVAFTGNMSKGDSYEAFQYQANLEADDLRNITISFQYTKVYKNQNFINDIFITTANFTTHIGKEMIEKSSTWARPSIVEKISDYSIDQLKNNFKNKYTGMELLQKSYMEQGRIFDSTP